MTFTPTDETRSVSFGGAIVSGFRNYANFSGRASVAEYWWFTLAIILVSCGLAFADQLVDDDGAITVISSVWGFGMLLPVLAVTVRRLRDAGNSLLQLLWVLVPVAGAVVFILRMCDPSLVDAGLDTDLTAHVATDVESTPRR